MFSNFMYHIFTRVWHGWRGEGTKGGEFNTYELVLLNQLKEDKNKNYDAFFYSRLSQCKSSF